MGQPSGHAFEIIDGFQECGSWFEQSVDAAEQGITRSLKSFQIEPGTLSPLSPMTAKPNLSMVDFLHDGGVFAKWAINFRDSWRIPPPAPGISYPELTNSPFVESSRSACYTGLDAGPFHTAGTQLNLFDDYMLLADEPLDTNAFCEIWR
jgi:hypothetical protein